TAMLTPFGRILLSGFFAAAVTTTALAQGAVKPGRWEFTTQMQMPATPQLPPGVSLPPGVQAQPGGMSATHTSCIDPERAVPHDPRQGCRIDRMNRNGGTITWSTSCTTQQGTVHSDGEAHYHGDTMDATMTTRVPVASGQSMDNVQRITGRYLGPCGQPADLPAAPPHRQRTPLPADLLPRAQ